jgi:hypothetical protein
MLLKMFLPTLLLITFSYPDANFDAMPDNSWIRLARTGNGPTYGADVHSVCDTSGYMYMFGGCTYGSGAGNAHNNDVYRFNLKTGYVDRLSNCSNNAFNYSGGCQAGQAYDVKRNCVWFTNGFSATCGSGRGGLLKFQCPAGPVTQVNSSNGGEGAHFFSYDPVNDLVYCPGKNQLHIYNPATNTWSTANYPFGESQFEDPVCPNTCDTKRGLFIITMTSAPVRNIFAFNGATKTWTTKIPPALPSNGDAQALAYDQINDKYVYFGGFGTGCNGDVWYYDYTSNVWAHPAQTGKSYNDATPTASTWAPYSHYHSFSYSPKYNVCVAWGGGQVYDTDKSCSDYESTQPLWMYRLAGSGTSSEFRLAPKNIGRSLSVFPNPSSTGAAISLSGSCLPPLSLAIYDASGRKIRDLTSAFNNSGHQPVIWDGSGNRGERTPAGIYLIKYESGNITMQKALIRTK